MTVPPERSPDSPEATRAGSRPRPRNDLLVVILVLVLVAGTIFVTQATRKRRLSRPPAAPPEAVNDPAALGLPALEVALELQSVASRIQAAWKRDGAPPASLEGLPPDEDDPPPDPDSPSRRDPPLDAWGRPYRLERSVRDGGTVLTLTTYGSDGEAGGEGDEQDLVMEIAAPAE